MLRAWSPAAASRSPALLHCLLYTPGSLGSHCSVSPEACVLPTSSSGRIPSCLPVPSQVSEGSWCPRRNSSPTQLGIWGKTSRSVFAVRQGARSPGASGWGPNGCSVREPVLCTLEGFQRCCWWFCDNELLCWVAAVCGREGMWVLPNRSSSGTSPSAKEVIIYYVMAHRHKPALLGINRWDLPRCKRNSVHFFFF